MRKMGYICSIKSAEKGFYVYPQFEIQSGDVLRIVDKKYEFPNNGTVWIIDDKNDTENQRKRLSSYCGKLCILEWDEDNAILNNYHSEENPRSCKYCSYPSFVKEVPYNKIIQVITCSVSIEDIISNAEKRILSLEDKPLSNKIILVIDGYAYGYFEWSSVNKMAFEDTLFKQDYQIRLEPPYGSNYCIKVYKYDELDKFIYSAMTFNNNSKNFVYSLEKLDKINPIKTIDFIDDENLYNLFIKILKNDEAFSQLSKAQFAAIKQAIYDTSDIPSEFSDARIKRISKIMDVAKLQIEVKNKLINELLHSPKIQEIVESLLLEKEDKLIEAIKQSKNEKHIFDRLEKEKEILEKEKQDLEIEIAGLKDSKKLIQEEAIQKRKEEIANLDLQIAEMKRKISELQAFHSAYSDINSINAKVSQLKEEAAYLEKLNAQLTASNKQLLIEQNRIAVDINGKISELVINKMNNDIIGKLMFNLTSKNIDSTNNEAYSYDGRILRNLSANDIIDRVYSNFEKKAKRHVRRDDIVNLLISLTQNFITILAGEPGVGKTSMCSIISKSLGLCGEGRKKRYIEIPVERGWTSRKDLIGYYNPLTKNVEKTNIDFFNALLAVTEEVEKGINNIPLFVLLDEANLSPIEHYWASFMHLNDIKSNSPKEIALSDNVRFRLNDGFRFLATINYDHTTEMLSPRFLDRACVILVEPIDLKEMLNSLEDEEDIDNAEGIIDFNLLKEFFYPKEGDFLDARFNTLLNSISEILKENNTFISGRSINAIKNYCLAATKHMDISENAYIPLDFAVSQKILPQLNGYGDRTRNTILRLMEICKEMPKTYKILERMKDTGDNEHGYYQFFAR